MNIEILLDRPIAFHRPFVDVCGSITAALFLSQAVYWSKRCATHQDGKKWFYKTQAEWEEETGMSRREQETARKRLVSLGILSEKKLGVPAKLFYSIDFNTLSELLACTNKDGGKRQTRMAESDITDCTKPPYCDGGKRQTITEITTETTTENTTKNTYSSDDEDEVCQKAESRKQKRINYQECLNIYNEVVGDKLPHAVEANTERKRKLKALIESLATPNEIGFRAYVQAFMNAARPFHFGENDRGWVANFDYLLQRKTLTKIREGTL